nr:MAG TPA: hypothetical protein [Caudoviricetes sp.]
MKRPAKKYTRKQICEAISYWRKQLRIGNYENMNESIDGTKYIIIKEGIDSDFMTTYDTEFEALDDFNEYLDTIQLGEFDLFYVEYDSGYLPLYHNDEIVPKTKEEVMRAFDRSHFLKYDDYHVSIEMILLRVNNLDEIKNFLISNGQKIEDLGNGNFHFDNLYLDCNDYEFWDLLVASNQDLKSKKYFSKIK